jgi:acetyl-CoA carboxylase biotin carboxyl carrier protein
MSENLGSSRSPKNKEQAGERSKKPDNSKKLNHTIEPSLNMAELYELANLVDEHGFTDFEFENANIRVRLSKNPAPQIVNAAQPYAQIPTAPQPLIDNLKRESAGEDFSQPPILSEDVFVLTSPIVGTFYSAPSPDKDAYVKLGSKVSATTHVCIIEAMKLMNEIEAEQAGEIVTIYVENGQPVEYGQPLFGIKK